MYKNKSKWVGVVLAFVMILVFTTPIFAEGEVGSVEPPEVVEETSSFFDHPIVRWIVKFIFNPIEVVGEDPAPEMGGVDLPGEEPPPTEGPLGDGGSTEGIPEPTPEPEPEPEPELIPVVVPEETIAAMHVDEKLGFGEIVKLLEIAENAQAKCVENNEENCEVTLGSVIVEYEDGTGMGELVEKHGKPENLGVGQIREEMNPNNKEKSNNGNGINNGAEELSNTGAGDEQILILAGSNITLPQESDPKDKEKSNNGKAKEKDNSFYLNITD